MKCIEDGNALLSSPPADKISNRSAPVIESISLKKHYDRSNLAKAIRENAQPLKHVESVSDRSAPYIEQDIVINFSKRRAFLYSLKLQAEQFLERLRLSANQSADNVKQLAETAPVKTKALLEQTKALAHKGAEQVQALADQVADSAAVNQHKAASALNSAVATGKIRMTEAKINAQGLVDSGKEAASQAVDQVKETAQLTAAKTSAIASLVREKSSEALHKGQAIFQAGDADSTRLYATEVAAYPAAL